MVDKRIEIIYSILDLIADDYYQDMKGKSKDKKEQADLIYDAITYIREALDTLDYIINRRRF